MKVNMKMKFYVTSGVAEKLMESYLRNRYQRVIINTHKIQVGIFLNGKKYKMGSHGVQFLEHYFSNIR